MFTGRNLAIFGGGHQFDRVLPPEAFEIVARWESFVPTPYSDRGKGAQGYGHTDAKGPPLVVPGSTWTLEYAWQVLNDDMNATAKEIDKLVKVPVSRYQWGALCSLAFNTGTTRFKTLELLSLLNGADPKNYTKAAAAFLQVNTSKNPDTGIREVLDGLTLRRCDEISLFMRRIS